MREADFRKQSAVVLADHELDDDAFERLIEEKVNRARAYYEALYKRDEEFSEQD
jgi:hypothetical protein